MSDDQDQGRAQYPWSNPQLNSQNALHGLSVNPDVSRSQRPPNQQRYDTRSPYSAPAGNPGRLPERPNLPTRSSTVGTPDPDRNQNADDLVPHAKSEDLNHGYYGAPLPGSSPTQDSNYLSANSRSRPSTPGSSSNRNNPSSSSGHSDESDRRLSVTSFSSAQSGSSSQSGGTRAPPTTASSTSASVSASAIASSACASCGKPMSGSFVRALGTVFHLDCFKCMDCGEVVANKFFPFEGSEGSQQPLCERDYFRRLNLICAKCNMALRGSYITACNKKFHVEHFTCSLCPTLFGPQDSYYEHDGNVYCHFHYSTRFATKCAGCSSAILKQFVEINRNSRDECWHPECYMINKFWNVKVSSRRPTSTTSVDTATALSFTDDEQRDTPSSLKERQIRMEQQVYRIWTVLSAFEESSAACISDMLRQVSNGQYLDAIRMAEKFILHVEVLFATIDDLEYHFLRLNQKGSKGMSHVREARMLCRKTVELFTLLSHTQETGARRMGMTQELLALVTGLAHYLKILIRIALTGALKLEREQSVNEAMSGFLDKLHLLAVQGGNPSARRLLKGSNGELLHSNGGNIGTQGVAYGFGSLAPENAGESPFSNTGASKLSPTKPPSDLCVKCGVTVEEDCVRLGTYQRWHSNCVSCATCGKVATAPMVKEPKGTDEKDKDGQPPKLSTARRPPANVGAFVFDPASMMETTSFGDVPTIIYCTDHAQPNCRSGFQAVQRLEQYAFLLNVALRRLYLLLKKQGVVPLSPVTNHASPYSDTMEASDPYRNNNDIMRMKSVHLDRKLSATAHLPKRSTIVESPAGRTAHPHDVLKPQKSQELGVAQSQRSAANIPPAHHGSQGQVHHHHHHALQPGGRSPQLTSQPAPAGSAQSARPQLGRLPIDSTQGGQVLRPSFARNNTEVMIVDDSTPNSPAGGAEDALLTSVPDDGITLADIPQIMERAQAREQHRPRQHAVPFVADLNALELTIIKHTAVLVLSRSPLKDQFDLDDILESLENKKGGFWNKFLFKANDKKIKKKGVFGVPLELLVEREGADSLLGASRATLRVPSFIDDVISAMRQMDMSVEGIFRKNGNIRHLKDLTEAIDRDPSSVDLSSDHPVQLAALLKKFLRDLPDPLLTFKLHRLLVVTQTLPQEADRRRYLHLVSLLLPKSHRDTMEVLFVFLKWVASFAHMDEETGSKMDLGNLATVICPSILYPRGRDPRDESFGPFGAIRVVTALLEDQDLFLTVPEDFLDIINDKEYFASAVDLPGKDFMRKCDTWLRSKGRAGASSGPPHNQRPPPGPPYPERPPLGHSVSERTARPPPHSAPPGTPQGNGALYLPPSALQSMSVAQAQTPPQSHEWRPPLPSSDSNISRSPVSRPSFDQANMLPPNTNGYTPAVQQRT